MEDDQINLPDAKVFVEAAFHTVREYCSLASTFPTNDDYEYQCAFPGFPRHVRTHADALLEVMDLCVAQVPKKRRVTLSSTSSRGGGSASAAVVSATQRHTAIMETVDSLLENVDHLLDEARGQRLNADDQLHVAFGSALHASTGQTSNTAGKPQRPTTTTIVRPQLSFDKPVDNSHEPFKATIHNDDGTTTQCAADIHPFSDLIESFKVPTEQLLPTEDKHFLPLDTTPLTFVETPEALDGLISVLLTCREVAVDLEHHDLRSYQGITCLMQLSTRAEDYIVDVLRLRSHMHRLNRVFLNPNILKVFHGAKEDIRWLQKDFDLYVANLFDTGIALQTLHMPHSLAFAVDHFCGVRLDKRYQTADWRIRPVPAEMVHYARQDTHYLLYVHDRLKALLLHAEGRASVGNLLVHVYGDSRRLCLTRYEKPVLDVNTTFRDAMGKSLGGLSPVQLEVLRVVFNWRDQAARDADESPQAIMHASAILQIASKLPTSAKEILSCCAPVSVVVRRDIGQLCDLVKRTLTERGVDCEGNGASRVSAARAAGGMTGPLSARGATQSAGSDQLVHDQRAYQPMSGMLPSISAVTEMVVSSASQSPREGLFVSTAFTPSAWFRAMQLVSNAPRTSESSQIQLPGANIVARAKAAQEHQRKALMAAKAASAALPSLPDAYGGQANEEEDLSADCIQFSRHSAEDEAQNIGGECTTAGDGVEDAVPTTSGEGTSPKKKPKSLEDISSVFEELGSGRAGRRKQQQQKRNRNE